ncbi:MAG: hypothetical protein OXC96_01885, partial [Cyanobacteria bacterium MAG CAR1_bin_15]|nr:hypothetical protein [Cyanobacteria bacterium MAG CAR1_bin_15]
PWKEERAPLPRGSVAVLLPPAPALLLLVLVVGGEGEGGAGHQVGAADGLEAQQLAPCPSFSANGVVVESSSPPP